MKSQPRLHATCGRWKLHRASLDPLRLRLPMSLVSSLWAPIKFVSPITGAIRTYPQSRCIKGGSFTRVCGRYERRREETSDGEDEGGSGYEGGRGF
jgi:hypothetical protein